VTQGRGGEGGGETAEAEVQEDAEGGGASADL